MKIITKYDPPPIPLRHFDWTAVLDDFDLGSPVGHGQTEVAAIADLHEQLERFHVHEE